MSLGLRIIGILNVHTASLKQPLCDQSTQLSQSLTQRIGVFEFLSKYKKENDSVCVCVCLSDKANLGK